MLRTLGMPERVCEQAATRRRERRRPGWRHHHGGVWEEQGRLKSTLSDRTEVVHQSPLH